MEQTIPLNLLIDSQLKALLAETAKREERTMTAIVERALRLYFSVNSATAAEPANGQKVTA